MRLVILFLVGVFLGSCGPSTYYVDSSGNKSSTPPASWQTNPQRKTGATISSKYDFYRKGVEEYKDGHHKAAALYFRNAADKGHVSAMHNLGVYYSQGLGGHAIDVAEAKYWYRQAASLGHKTAMNNLGLILYKEGAQTDGRAWLEKAARLGEPHAQKTIQALNDHAAMQRNLRQNQTSKANKPPSPETMEAVGNLGSVFGQILGAAITGKPINTTANMNLLKDDDWFMERSRHSYTGASKSYSLTPSGSYVRGNTYTLCPDGSHVAGSSCTLTPSGNYVGGGAYTLTPGGNYVGGQTSTLCPDGTYVGGNECILTPSGYIGR